MQPPKKNKKSFPTIKENFNLKEFLGSLSRQQIALGIAAICTVVVLIAVLIMLIISLNPKDVPSDSSVSGSVSQSSSFVHEGEFDKDSISRVSEEYEGTLLQETEDAGDQYLADTVFLGDSNTARLITYGDTTGLSMDNTIGIESMGITSLTSLRCVRFSGYSDMTMPSAVELMQPLRVVINFGTNNAGMSTETFKNHYRTAVEAIQEEWPYADIIIASVLPITSTCSYTNISMSWVESINLTLLELAEEMDVKFLNWSEAIKDSNTGYAKNSYMVSDGIHISEAGAEAMIDYFRTHSYETEDTRPMPLNSVPNRLATPEGLFPKPVFPTPEESTTSATSVSSSSTQETAPPVVSSTSQTSSVSAGSTPSSTITSTTPPPTSESTVTPPAPSSTAPPVSVPPASSSEAEPPPVVSVPASSSVTPPPVSTPASQPVATE